MNDYIIGHIRTWVPIVVGALISFLVTLGLEINPETQTALIIALTGLIQAVYYALVRALAEKWPWVGSFLGVNKAPEYFG